MWQLDRIMLRAVGHPDARFAPLDVDLTNDDPRSEIAVGTPVDTVLWMENGTGKTTLLSLALSVLRPRRSEFLSKDRDLADYVRANDVAHVVLVLSRPVPGNLLAERERLVVGQSIAWRNARHSGRTEDLQRAHWGFRASGTLDTDALPVCRDDGRPSTLNQFNEELRRLMQANPQSEYFTPDANQSRWEEWLAARQVDTEIFRQQIGINADEGHISEAFNFPSGDAFVRWVLERTTTGDGLAMLATQVGELHDLLGSREPLKHEADLCVQLASALDLMDEAHTLIEEAEAAKVGVYNDASVLAAQLDAAHTQASDHAAEQASLAEDAETRSRNAATQQRLLQRQAVTARRRAAELRLAAAQSEQQEVHKQLEDATFRRDAWQTVGDVLAQGELASRHQMLSTQLAALDDRLQPLRTQLDEVRKRFSARAHQLLDSDARTEADLRERVEQIDEERQACDSRIGAARAAATAAREAAAAAGASLEALDRQLRQAVSQGLVVDGQDLDIAFEQAQVTRDRASGDHAEAVKQHEASKQAVATARTHEQEAHAGRADAAANHHQATERAQQMATAAKAVTDNPEVRTVADTDDFDPFAVGDVLVERLRRDALAARGRVVDARVSSAATRRLDETIERTSLAPARLDLEQAVTLLREGGIDAHTGWAYLADSVSPHLHRGLSTNRPDIADGLVVDTDTDRDQALAILADSQPWAPIRVSTKSEVDDVAQSVDDGNVVIAHPALHDRDVAADLRTDLAGNLAEARNTEAELQRRAEQLAEAVGAVERLLQAWPDPTAVRDAVTTTADTLQAAHDKQRAAVEARKSAEEAFEAAAEQVATAERAANQASQRLTQTKQLRDDQRDRTPLVEKQTASLRDASNLNRAVQRDEHRLGELSREREQRLVDIAAVDNHTEAVTDRCQRLHIALDSTPAGVEHDAPDTPLDVLEEEHTYLTTQLSRERDDSGLHADLEAVEAEQAQVAAKLLRVDEQVLDLARQLAASVDAADATRRRASAAQAEQHRDELRDQSGGLRERVERLVSELAEFDGIESRPVETEGLDADECEALATQLTEQGSIESAKASELAKTAQQRSDRAAEERSRASAFEQAAKNLRASGDEIRDVAGADPWSGDDPHEAVRQIDVQLKRVNDELAEAKELRSEQHLIVRGVVDDPTNHHFGNEDEAAAPIVVELRRLAPAALGAVAGRYRDEMLSRRERIEEKLADIDRHRAALAKMLLHETESALQTLHTVGLRSRMPDGLGEWSGRQFLTIRHDQPPTDDRAMADRMTRVIDDIVDRGASPSANELQFAGVRAAVGGDGFRVRIIKPHEELRHDPVDVTELNTFSGGQRLTAAVALFLTLMNMRNLAGGNRRGAAVLLLDNPFGKSSADTFVHVQRMLAERLGVQLVYTTAVKDLGALSQFRKTIRFAKKRHTGTGSLHVVEDEGGSLRSATLDRLRDSIVGEGAA